MGRPRRETCRDCGKHISEVGPLSRRGKCEPCGIHNMVTAAEQIENRRGPMYDKYRRETQAYADSLSRTS